MSHYARVTAVLVAVLACAACTPSTPTPSPSVTASQPTSSPSPSLPPSVSPSPSPEPTIDPFPDKPEKESAEQAEVRAGWQAYLRVSDKIARDPFLDLSETQLVTTGQAAAEIIRSFNSLRKANLKRIGDPVFRDAVISKPSTNADGVRTAEVRYCFDATRMKTVDADTGKEGENTLNGTMKVKNLMEKMPDDSWRVALTETEIAPC